MKVITHNLSEQGKGDIRLYYLADFHIGDPGSDYKLIKDVLDRIMADDDAYCMLGGDLMNTAIKTSVSDTYDETLTPQQELEQCVKLFKPLAEKGKILGILGGNHEARIYRNDGIDVTKMLAMQLGIVHLYSSETLAVNIKTGSNRRGRPVSYLVYAVHGSGGGKKWGGKINRLVDYGNIIDADLIFAGHTHSPAIVKQGFIRWNPQNGSTTQVEKCFVNTSAMIGRYGGYGEVQGFQPPSNAVPMVTLSGTERKITATM